MSAARLVLDLGHSLWKGKRSTGAEHVMPHAIVEISNAQYADALARYKKNLPKDIFKVNGKAFATGASAEAYGMIQRFKGAERYKPQYFGVSAMAMILGLYEGNKLNIEIFASHPPQHVQYADDLIDSLFGVHNGEWQLEHGERSVSVSVDYVNTFDEATGGIMNVMLNEDGAHYQRPELKKGKIITIDLGGGTTDFTETLDGEINYLTPWSEPIGIGNVIDDFTSAFRQRYKAETRGLMSLDAAKVRTALISGEYSGGGSILDCKEEANQARNKLLNRVLQVFQNRYGGAFNYDGIILTGGGSALMADALFDNLQHDRIILADDHDSLHLANVRGGLKLWKLYEHMGIS